eukprot:scaffold14221_cov103-Cyclotella_meneghiniana.AAC.3
MADATEVRTPQSSDGGSQMYEDCLATCLNSEGVTAACFAKTSCPEVSTRWQVAHIAAMATLGLIRNL